VTQALTHTLVELVGSYGLLGILVLMAAESCGLPFPSEVIMPVGGALVAAGHLPLVPVILAGAIGNLVGSLAAYGLAARFGEPLLLGPGRWVGFSRTHLELAQRWFARYGLLAVFLGRVLPVVRTYISFPAGLARVRLGPFSLLTLVGALPWCAALTAVGYFLGSNYERISGPIEKIAIGVAALVAIVVVVWFVRGRRRATEEGPRG
jgi:membrane protein DedA with SNARE-associated domain